MFRSRSIRYFIYPLLILLSSSCGGGGSSPPTPNETAPASIEDILQKAVTDGVDGIFVYVEQRQQITNQYSAGLQNRSSQTAASADSLFKIASNSKLFIAVTAAKLAFQNVISLDDNLAFWLPDLATRIENSQNISLRVMLQHRSGIPDFDSQTGFSWQQAQTNIDQTLAYALDKPADFAPDAKYEYSNTNYLLIAKILDKALGYSHHHYIQSEILTPLGMTNTYAELGDVDVSLMVRGYWDNVDRTQQDYIIPGGSMISTVADMAIFIRELNTGTLLNSDERLIYSDIYSFGHSGWLPGYQSISRYHSDIDTIIIQFVNTTGGTSENIASNTYDLLLELLRK